MTAIIMASISVDSISSAMVMAAVWQWQHQHNILIIEMANIVSAWQ